MQRELMAQLPSLVGLVRHVRSVKEIALGPLCQRLIDIVQAIHKTRHILIDIKPDNLMIDGNFSLPSATVVKSKTILSTDDLAQSIRLVDFGLIKSVIGTSGTHMENMPTSQVQGTPLYASLHVHDLQSPSRRDDVYAMLYVIGEIVLCIDNLLQSKSDMGTDTASPSYFPWSHETSDAAIGKVKEEQMKSIQSRYFASMPNKTIAELLCKAHQLMHDTDFVKKPDYDAVKTLVSHIRIPVPAPLSSITSSAASKKRTQNGPSTIPLVVSGTVEPSAQLRRSTRQSSMEHVSDTVRGVATVDGATRPSKIMKSTTEVVESDSDDDDVTMHTAEQGEQQQYESDVEMMDIDAGDNEDRKPAAKTTSSEITNGLQFTIEGNATSHVVVWTKAEPTMVISSTSKSGDNNLFLPGWNGKLRLTLWSKVPKAIQVVPMGKQGCEIKVSKSVVPPSGTVAFFGQPICFGPYSIRNVQPLTKSQDVKENIPSTNTTAMDSTSNHRRGTKPNDVKPTTQSPPVPTNPFLVLKVKSPESMKGKIFVLEQNVSDTLTIGSDDASNNEKSGWICLPIEQQVEPKHARVSLIILRDGTQMVEVQDLKSSSGTFVSGQRIPTGKKEMAFCNHSVRVGNVELVVTNQL